MYPHLCPAQDFLCRGGGDCSVFVDEFLPYHAVALAWFLGTALLGSASLLLRRRAHADSIIAAWAERNLAQRRPLWRVAGWFGGGGRRFPGLSECTTQGLLCVLATLGCYAAFVSVAANDARLYSVSAGQAAGRLSAFMLSVSLFPVTRNSIWLHLAGIPFERAVKYHKWNSRALVIVFLAHGGRMMAQQGPRVLGSAARNGAGFGPCFGTAAAGCFLAMAGLSAGAVRRAYWELFKVSHMVSRVYPRIPCPLSFPPGWHHPARLR